MTLIAGIYPGGPGRRSDSPGEGRNRPLRGGEDLEGEMREGVIRGRQRRRRRRMYWVTIGGAAVAIGLGAFLGLSSIRSAEELAEADRAAQEETANDIGAQVDRVLDELWRMEAEEARRGGGRE